jgi:hypothetical protein
MADTAADFLRSRRHYLAKPCSGSMMTHHLSFP